MIGSLAAAPARAVTAGRALERGGSPAALIESGRRSSGAQILRRCLHRG